MRRLSSLLLLCAVGCSSETIAPPTLYPVTGSLVVGGKPLENVTVQLIPVDVTSKARPGSGKTDAEGKFTILTNGDKGATAGKYKVVLGSPSLAPSGPVSVEEATKMSGQYAKSGGPPAPVTLPYPLEWASATTSPKEVDVVDKPLEIKIDI